MIGTHDIGRHIWLALADEQSSDPHYIRDHADPEMVADARAWAREAGLPFPPPADIDDAQRLIERAQGGADYTRATHLLDEARERWEAFRETWRALGSEMRRIDPFLYQRIDAYPGWDGLRDVGAGKDLDGWMSEVAERLGVE